MGNWVRERYWEWKEGELTWFREVTRGVLESRILSDMKLRTSTRENASEKESDIPSKAYLAKEEERCDVWRLRQL